MGNPEADNRSEQRLASGWRWRRAFPGDDAQISVLRRWLECLLPPCPARDDLMNVAVELGTNAVRHTASGNGGRFVVEVTEWMQMTRVAVYGAGSLKSPRVTENLLSEDGRGLLMVNALSARMGVGGNAQGRVVWADIPWTDSERSAPVTHRTALSATIKRRHVRPGLEQAAGRVHGRARPCHRRQPGRHPMIRHFTATGIVLHQDTVLLIEHVKLGWWMPPGGHIDPNEDPVQAVLREVREETGLDCAIIAPDVFAHDAVQVLPAPFTILVEDVPEGGQTVQHIDCIYVLRPTSDPVALAAQAAEVRGVRWVPVSQVGELHTPPELSALIHAAAQSVKSLTGP